MFLNRSHIYKNKTFTICETINIQKMESFKLKLLFLYNRHKVVCSRPRYSKIVVKGYHEEQCNFVF